MRKGRVRVTILVTYLVGIAEFSHFIVGSVDAFYLVGFGQKTLLGGEGRAA